MKTRILFFFLVTSHASAERMNIYLQADEDGKVTPEFSVPHSWNENLFSSLSYSSSTTTTTGDSAITSSSSTTIGQDLIILGILGYKESVGALQFSGSLNYQYLTLDKKEFGYGELNREGNSDLFIIENHVDITSTAPSISADVTYRTDFFSIRSGANVTIGSNLDVEQNTRFQYQEQVASHIQSGSKQKGGYNIYAESEFNLAPSFGMVLSADYRVLPLDYTVSVLNSDLVSFSDQNISQESSTLSYSLLFIMKHSIAGMHPSLGITRKKVTSDDGDLSETTTGNYITFGFEQRF